MIASSMLARRLTLVALVAAGLQAIYWWGGHRLVAYEFAHVHGPFLYNLISTDGPHSLSDYLARADSVWRTFQLSWIGIALVLIAAPALDATTGRLHAAVLRFGHACAARPLTFQFAGALVVVLVTSIVGWLVLQHYPNSGDEYDYLYQAQTLLAGRLSNAPHPLQAFFETTHIIERNGRLFSVFPPGWPVMIAAAALVWIPAWAVAPLISGAVFVVTFQLARRVTNNDGVAALATLTLVWSSYFVLTGASYFSHMVCAALVVASMLAMLAMAGGSRSSAILAGFFAGLAAITRYYTPLLCLLPLALRLLRERRWRVEYLLTIAGAAPPLIFMLVYNHALSGNALVLSKGGVEQYDELWFAPGTWHRGGEYMLAHIGELLLWTPPALFFVYAATLRRSPLATRLAAVGAGFACVMLGLYPYINRGGNQYGPRFYFEAYPLLVIAASAWLFGTTRYEEMTRGARRLVYLFFVSLIVHVPIAASQMQEVHAKVVERTDVTRQVERAHLNHALVFITTLMGIDRLPETDFTRNGLTFDRPVLYVVDRGDANRELLAYYPDWSCYTYRYVPATRSGVLAPCAPR